MKKILLSILLILVILKPIDIHANSLSTSITGTTNVTAGSTFTLTFVVNNAVNAQGIQTRISFNPNHFSIVSATNLINNSLGGYTPSSNSYSASWTEYRSGNISFLRIVFQTLSGFTPNTNSQISLSNTLVVQGDPPVQLSASSTSVTIRSIAPLSTVNTLSSISINGTNLSNFSSNTLNYTLPDTQATSITINATRTDSRSTLTGTGTFPLSYGRNRFSLNVRSESGSTRTYTITVDRPDIRGDDTSIKSVSVGEPRLEWDQTNRRNILLVPHTIASSNLVIELNEASSRVTSPTSVNLEIGENIVDIVVRSERGTTQTYQLTLVRADEQGRFPEKFTSTALKHVLIDGTIYPINEGRVIVPFNVITPRIEFIPEHDLTQITFEEVESLEFGDNVINLNIEAFDTTVVNQNITIIREDQMNPVSLSELLENLDDFPVNTLSFFYEGPILDEEILNALKSSEKAFRVFVSTSTITGFWTLDRDDVSLLRDLDLSVSEDTSIEHQESLGFIIHHNLQFLEMNFPKPLPFTIVDLSTLSQYPTLYGYQLSAEGLQPIESWALNPLLSTIQVGGPLHLVITPVHIIEEEAKDTLDVRYVYAAVGIAVLGWLLWLISVVRFSRLKKKFRKLKKGVL